MLSYHKNQLEIITALIIHTHHDQFVLSDQSNYQLKQLFLDNTANYYHLEL